MHPYSGLNPQTDLKGVDLSAGKISFFNPPPIKLQAIPVTSAKIKTHSETTNHIIKRIVLPNKNSVFSSSLPTKSPVQDQIESRSNINWILEIYRRRVELYQRQLDEQRSLLIKVFLY